MPHADETVLTDTDAETVALVRRLCKTGEARRLRVEHDLSLDDVAQAVSATRAAVSRWERGLDRPRPKFALRHGQLLARLMQQQ